MLALSGASAREQATALGLPRSGPMSISRGRNGAIVVEIVVADTSDFMVDSLRAAGSDVVHVSSRYKTVTAAVGVGHLSMLAAVPGVQQVRPVLMPTLAADRTAPAESRAGNIAGQSAPAVRHLSRGKSAHVKSSAPRSSECGVLQSSASIQLKAALARRNFGVDGAGVKIGAISESFATASTPTSAMQDVASGALPGPGNPCGYTTPVQVIQEFPFGPASDEGRAMLQLVHGVAPGADLMFAVGILSITSMADNIAALVTAGADVIVDDLGQFPEPMFQEGILSTAITEATAAGVTYFSAAGNQNVIFNGHDVASWETPSYRPMSCPASVIAELALQVPPQVPASCMNFAPGGTPDDALAGYTISPGFQITPFLQWAEPINGVTSQLSVLVVNGSGVVTLPTPVSYPTFPVSVALYTNGGSTAENVSIVIVNFNSTTPRVKYCLCKSSPVGEITAVEYAASAGGDIVGPSIFGHQGGQNTLSTAAIDFFDSTTPETFSARGPVTYYFGPDTGDGVPAAPLAAPLVLDRPDFTATDNACTTFFGVPHPRNGPSCPYRFTGTSAAAPNAAAVAGLMLDANPALTPAQVRSVMSQTATPLSGGTPQSTGSGLIDANGAVSTALSLGPQTVSQTPCRKLPRKLKIKGTTLLLPAHCRTNSGQRIRVTAAAQTRGDTRLFRLNRDRNGRVRIKTYGFRIRLALTEFAPATTGFSELHTTTVYRVKRRTLVRVHD